MPETIAYLQPMSDALRKMVDECVPPGFAIAVATSGAPDHLRALIADADYAISWDIGVDGDLLRAAPRLKLLHKWGVGVDNFDLDTARALGIAVARTTGSNAIPVAEFTLAAMLAVSRRLIMAHDGMRSGRWLKNEVWLGSSLLYGKTVGIVGLGTIGKEVAKRVAAFGCNIVYHNRSRLSAAEEAALGAEYVTLPELLKRADIVSLNCPLTKENRGMIGAEQLATMKPSAILVNVARGGVVVEADLAEALRERRIAGAAVDVYEVEPAPADHPFLTLPNVLLTPHSAATAFDNSRKGILRMMSNIVAYSRGEDVPAIDSVVPRPAREAEPASRTG
jgi:phosphoglycerate dehydrogenase-like enzyme